jgi:hypothetical protein
MILGANYGFQAVPVDFVKSRIEGHSLDVSGSFSFSDILFMPLWLGLAQASRGFTVGWTSSPLPTNTSWAARTGLPQCFLQGPTSSSCAPGSRCKLVQTRVPRIRRSGHGISAELLQPRPLARPSYEGARQTTLGQPQGQSGVPEDARATRRDPSALPGLVTEPHGFHLTS